MAQEEQEAEVAGGAEEAEAARGFVGPFLYLRGVHEGRVDLAVAIVCASGLAAPKVRTADGEAAGEEMWECEGRRVRVHGFSLPLSPDAWYAVDDTRYPVAADLAGDLRVAFVSCNGQEEGDRHRQRGERNALWRRLKAQHIERPFHLLLQGGDQIYADELLDEHPGLERWARRGAGRRDRWAEADDAADLRDTLRRCFFRLYLDIMAQPETAWLMARIPTLAIWDDHDICDGWGSLPAAKLDAPAGRVLFEVAREHFLLFQLGLPPDRHHSLFPDKTGTSLTWHVRLPGLSVIAPDLRSERRPARVMGEAGWRALAAALAAVEDDRVLLLSSVPALGPRLSWVEGLMRALTVRMEKYEDDLRDQWQSRTHRGEWRRFLQLLAEVHGRGAPVTVLSGEIHLATRGTLDVPPAPIHQLTASGIAHPAPPRAYALALAILARFGKSPLPDHPLRLRPLPGRSAIYTAERNYLILVREAGAWRAWWELEKSGPTPPLAL